MNSFQQNRNQNQRQNAAPLFRALGLIVVATILFFCHLAPVDAYQISFPRPDSGNSIDVSSGAVTRWVVGQYEVLHLVGDVKIQQHPISATANEAIVWVEAPTEDLGPQTQEHKIIVYLEGQVAVDLSAADDNQRAGDRIVDEVWLGRFFTRATVNLNQRAIALGQNPPPAIFARAQQSLQQGINRSSVAPSDFTAQQSVISPFTGAVEQIQPNSTPGIGTDLSGLSSAASQQLQVGQSIPQNNPGIKFDITSRDSATGLNIKRFANPNNPNEFIGLAVGGVRIAVDSPSFADIQAFADDPDNKAYLSADDLVYWETTLPDGSTRNQFYLEGNVEFSKGQRSIYASRMFYDVEAQRGTILDAELLAKVADIHSAVRLKADVIEQYDENNLRAFGSAVTSSRLGVPRYWLQSGSVDLIRSSAPSVDPTTLAPVVNPQTGLFETEDQFNINARLNRVYVAGVPVFAWPRLRTNLTDPTLYLERLKINNDRIFGFQLQTGWDLYQVLGLPKPNDTEWIGVLDYLSERGVGYGSEYRYRRDSFFGIPGNVRGEYLSYFINDNGLDSLGLDRLDLLPEEDFRGRISLNHRHDFAPGYQLRLEVGYITDRNFLEQFYEREWDTGKDQTTGFWLERNVGTRSYNLTGDLQVNDFFTQTSGVNFRQFVLGQPVFNNRAIWHGSTQAGYLRLRVADPPLNAAELAVFDPLAGEVDADGLRVGTRQELDFPIQLGPTKVVPYLLGDATYWQEDVNGNDLTRLYGQIGIKASVPFWKVDPSIQSVLWRVNGLAHKVTFDVDAFYADASQDLADLPVFDQVGDDAQELFRRRFAFNTFGIAAGDDVPLEFDERNFAFRSGLQSNVTSPVNEVADDLAVVRFGVRQRWQTKRGLPGRERIIDWITLDTQTTLFPDANRDNFGADFGQFRYDFNWQIGNRFSFLSDGYFDFFSQGLRTASFGANLSRPESGDLYVGFRTIEGPISSNILSASLVYRLSDKWGVRAGGQVDFGDTGTIGQTLNVVYIGESFLWQLGFNRDVSRDNFGVRFGFEPRFLNRPRLFRPGGVPIQPVGSRGIE